MGYGVTITPSDTGIPMNIDAECKNFAVIDSFTMSEGGGSKSYTQSPSSGGVPNGSSMNYSIFWFGYRMVSYERSPRITLSQGNRVFSWTSYEEDFNPATCTVISDLSGSFSYSGEYGITMWGNSIRNTLSTNRNIYVLQAKGTYSAGSNENVIISNSAFNSSTALIFARCTGGNFIAVQRLNDTSLRFGRSLEESPRDYSTDKGTASGNIEWLVFDKYTQGNKPSFGLELHRRDGVISYRSEKSLLLLKGLVTHPYQVSYNSEIGNGYSYSYASAGGGYVSTTDASNTPMLMVYPVNERVFTITAEDASGYAYSTRYLAGYRVGSSRQVEIGSAGYESGAGDGYYNSGAITQTEISNLDLKIPFVWRSSYF